MKIKLIPLIITLSLGQSPEAISALSYRADNMPSVIPMDNRCILSTGTPVIDYGNQSRWQLQDAGSGNAVSPGKRMLMLNVVCPYTQSMRLVLHGDHTANGNLRYGSQGSVNIRLLAARLDGQEVQIATTTADGVINATPVANPLLQPGNRFAAVQNGQLAKGKSLSIRLEIEPVLAESAARVSTRQTSESYLTIETN